MFQNNWLMDIRSPSRDALCFVKFLFASSVFSASSIRHIQRVLPTYKFLDVFGVVVAMVVGSVCPS